MDLPDDEHQGPALHSSPDDIVQDVVCMFLYQGRLIHHPVGICM